MNALSNSSMIKTWIIGRRGLLAEGLFASLERSRFRIDCCIGLDYLSSSAWGDTGPPLLCLHVNEMSLPPRAVSVEAARIRKQLPNSIIITIAPSRCLDVMQLLTAGANGCLSVGFNIEELTFLLEHVVDPHCEFFIFPSHQFRLFDVGELSVVSDGGNPVIPSGPPSPTIGYRATESFDETAGIDLSRRECEVLAGLFNGESNKALARRLVISEATVKAHIRALFRKLGAHNRTQAVKLVMDQCPQGVPLDDWLMARRDRKSSALSGSH